ncbi:MAG: hypothetical protein IID17_14575, partial [Nitrospinae bacterium]|nr:hypothetical protein [Nitrospinota bacterium]
MLDEAELKELVKKINRAIKNRQLCVVTEYFAKHDVVDLVENGATIHEKNIHLDLRGVLTPGKQLSLNDWFKGHRQELEASLEEYVADEGEELDLKDFAQLMYLECYDGQ